MKSPLAKIAAVFVLLICAPMAFGQSNSAGLYGTANMGVKLVKIDLSAQSATLFANPTGQIQGYSLAFDPAGNAYTVVNLFLPGAQLASLDLNTGAATLEGQTFAAWYGGQDQKFAIMGIVFTPDGRLLAGAMPPPKPTSIYELDRASGQPTLVGWTDTSADGGELMSFAYDPTTGVLYAATPTQLFTVNATTGAATYLSKFHAPIGATAPGNIMGLAIDDDGNMYAADFTSSSKIYSVDRSTGLTTLLFNTNVSRVHNITFNPGGPAEQLATLAARIGRLGLPNGIANSLAVKTAAALAALNRGQTGVTCNVISAFTNEVNALGDDRLGATTQEFAFRVTRLQTALGCQ